MQLRSKIEISCMLTAMKNVVIPAIEEGNDLAMEQAQLVVGMLSLMEQQLPVQFYFDRDELDRLVETAKKLNGICSGNKMNHESISELNKKILTAENILRKCIVDPSKLNMSARELRHEISVMVTEVGNENSTSKAIEQMEKIILDSSKEQFLRDRSLMLPQGWELDAGLIPEISTLLGVAK